jgi:two-component sensor histidine kinase
VHPRPPETAAVKDLILAVLSRERPHPIAGYMVSLTLVLLVLWLELSFPQTFHRYLPFLPIVLVVAVAFGRNAGFVATLTSMVSANAFAILSFGWRAVRWPEPVFLVLYLVVGLGLSWVTDALQHAVSELRRAESEKSLLLDELVHRTRNDLMMVISVLTVQAQRQADPRVRAELESAVSRVRVIAEVQERLRDVGNQSQVELAGYLEALGHSLSQLQQDVRPIAVHVAAQRARVKASVAMSVGLIANELITNAFKYAFPQGRSGTVEVRLERATGGMVLSVQDDGIGCTSGKGAGMGSRLVSLLASHMGGTVERVPSTQGHHVRVTLPIEPDEVLPIPGTPSRVVPG